MQPAAQMGQPLPEAEQAKSQVVGATILQPNRLETPALIADGQVGLTIAGRAFDQGIPVSRAAAMRRLVDTPKGDAACCSQFVTVISNQELSGKAAEKGVI